MYSNSRRLCVCRWKLTETRLILRCKMGRCTKRRYRVLQNVGYVADAKPSLNGNVSTQKKRRTRDGQTNGIKQKKNGYVAKRMPSDAGHYRGGAVHETMTSRFVCTTTTTAFMFALLFCFYLRPMGDGSDNTPYWHYYYFCRLPVGDKNATTRRNRSDTR